MRVMMVAIRYMRYGGLDMVNVRRMLIVDDEQAIAAMLGEYFELQGYTTIVANSAAEALAAVDASLRSAAARIDIVLLDVNMPGMDGFELCRRMRSLLSCPIIFLTARVEDADQIDGFAAGGDDYVVKPFSLDVLGERVRAHLMREDRRATPVAAHARIYADITIDFGRRRVEVASPKGAQGVALTKTEFDIVELLSKAPGHVFDRDVIYERVWGWGAEGDPSIVREHIRRIRKKLAQAGARQDHIETVWGVGYRWAAR